MGRIAMNQFLKTISRAQLRQISTSAVSQNVCYPKPDYGSTEVYRSTLLNGIRVVSAKHEGAPIGACTIMWQAGSRYEVDDQLGASHFIRACSSASGCGYSSFHKMRMLHQYGVSITCSTDRQTVAYTIRCPWVNFPQLKHYLIDMAARCCYNQWELDDRKALIRDDLLRIPPEQRVLDMIQTASWNGPLTNSMFCKEGRIDKMTEDIMNCYAFTNFKTDELTVASVGIPFEETLKIAEKIEFKLERPEPRLLPMSCPRAGFEYYDLGRNSDTWIAVAVPSVGTCDLGCLLKHAIIAAACGTTDIQSGLHAMDRTLMPPLGARAGPDVYTSYRAFNISYRETGLFGILAKTRSCSAWEVAIAASEFLTNVGDITYQQIEIGRARLKLNLCLHDEDCVRVAEGMALQAANYAPVDNVQHAIAIIDQISTDEISCTAKMLSSKSCMMAYAVVGDIGAVPHDRELTRYR